MRQGRGRATPVALGDMLESWDFIPRVTTGSSSHRTDMVFLMLWKTTLPRCKSGRREIAQEALEECRRGK